MRGSPSRAGSSAPQVGIIPAHAGLTQQLIPMDNAGRDHPRACGAHFLLVVIDIKCLGSSPRMRGSRTISRSRNVVSGIIPAHAGLTGRTSSSGTPSRDHPRACGAHFLFCLHLDYYMGSSPRMRGSPAGSSSLNRAKGIIPAHAGLTVLYRSRLSALRDHPRACGAHLVMTIGQSVIMGSSPRMRGSRQVGIDFSLAHGIIPAHAGLTYIKKRVNMLAWDHPRACGAHCLLSDLRS